MTKLALTAMVILIGMGNAFAGSESYASHAGHIDRSAILSVQPPLISLVDGLNTIGAAAQSVGRH